MNWKPIKGFEDYYLISEDGSVWSLRRRKILSTELDRYGYLKVVLSVNGKCSYKTVHRLVAETFIPNPMNYPTVNHINENKTDNRISNLEWVSVKANVNHGTRNERMAKSKCHKPVEQLFQDGTSVKFDGVKDASRKTGIHRCQIAKCCKNTIGMAGGYKWRYINEID